MATKDLKSFTYEEIDTTNFVHKGDLDSLEDRIKVLEAAAATNNSIRIATTSNPRQESIDNPNILIIEE
jgi:hypothetical protein